MANKKRLVNAEAIARKLKNAHCAECNVVRKIQCSACWVEDVLELLEGDAVDAVEVVRCKDCKHYDNSEGICWCKLNSKFFPGGMDWHGFPEDGFCSYGERKNDSETL